MQFGTIRFRTINGTGIISLNRPERMNAVIEEMYSEILQALDHILKNKNIRAVILTGSSFQKNGIKKEAFCAGADLKKHSEGNRTPEDKKSYITLAHEACRMIYEFPKPVIASINGPARGAGAEMALNCDFILMAEKATIAFPETGLGTCVGGAATRHLTAITGLIRAKELIYTGKILNGKEAAEYGIALKTFPIERLEAQTLEFAESLTEKAPVSMRYVKELIQDSSTLSIKETLNRETEAILSCMKTSDWHEGIKAFDENRKPKYKGI